MQDNRTEQYDRATGRRELEKALRENEGLYRHLVDSACAIPWKVDIGTWSFTYVGPQALKLLGYPVEAWYADHFWDDHLHPDDRAEAIRSFRTAAGRGENYEFEYRMIAADGRTVWIRDTLNVVKDKDVPVALQGYIFDISVHKLATEALDRSHAEFEAMFNSIPDAVLFVDTKRHIVMNNPAMCKMFGYCDKELIGRTTEMLYADKQDFADQGRRRYRTGPDTETAPYELRYRHKNGTTFWTETLGTHVKDANGTMIGFIAVFRDITERKEAAEKLRESEARIRMVIEAALDAIIVIDDDSVIQEWNPQAEVIFGWKSSEIIGQTLMETIIPARYKKAHTKGVENLLKTGKGSMLNKHIELTAMHRDGHAIPIEISILPLQRRDSWTFSAFIRDLSERKQGEEILKQSDASFKALAEESPNMIYINTRGRIVFANKACEDQTGYARHEFYNRDFDFMCTVAPESRELIRQKYMLHQKGEEIAPYEYKVITKDKKMLTVIHSSRLIEFEGERSILGIITDITKRKEAEEMIRASERELSAILDSMQDAYYRVDREGHIIRLSPSVQKLLGYSPRQLLGTKLKGLYVDPQSHEEFLKRLKGRGGNINNYEVQLRHKDGSTVWASTNAHYVRDEQGNPIGVEGTTRDISMLKASEDLRIRFGRILDNSSNEIYIFDADSLCFSLVNQGARTNLGYSMQELEHFTPLDLKPDFTLASFEELLQPLRERSQEQVVFPTRHRRKDGSLYPVEVRLQLSHQESPPVFVAMIQDITEHIQTEERLQYLAHHDALTTLPNRVLFTDRLEQSLARTHWHDRAVAVLFLDLDRFKNINDTLGHDVGDRALQALSARLKDCVREGDTVARLGGDEFAIVLEDIATADDVAPTARKILDILSQPFRLDEHEFVLTTSIGISLCPIDGKDTQTLLKHADIAMYRAKEQGRNTYQFYSADMSVRAFERLNLESNLRHALEREEFVLYYQPQQELASGRVVGVEALLRWQHPSLGLIAPIKFVPLLEETSMILPVGEWALKTACKQAKAWNDDASMKPLRMSVNLSVRQVNNANFVTTVKRILEESELDPALLELEITESILLHNMQPIVESMNNLSEIGVRFAIDDFGTGYSALSYLKQFPISTLKIDRSFITDLIGTPDDATLVEAIIAMGRTLHLNVIAEGVETRAQADRLSSYKCDEFQGFLLSRPLPAAEITTFLT